MAENILALLRPDASYSFWEAHVLDVCLTLHAEHGGGKQLHLHHPRGHLLRHGYILCMAAALASLKGPKHGGANIKASACLRT